MSDKQGQQVQVARAETSTTGEPRKWARCPHKSASRSWVPPSRRATSSALCQRRGNICQVRRPEVAALLVDDETEYRDYEATAAAGP